MQRTGRIACLSLACLAALAACQREQPAPVAAPAPPAAAPEAAPPAAPTSDPRVTVISTNTVMAEAGVQPKESRFSVKEFAGVFAGTTATGTATRIALQPDGTYTLEDRSGNGAPLAVDGHWTFEKNGAELLLDPNTKEAPDRAYQIIDRGELRAVAADGVQPAYVLKRSGG